MNLAGLCAEPAGRCAPSTPLYFWNGARQRGHNPRVDWDGYFYPLDGDPRNGTGFYGRKRLSCSFNACCPTEQRPRGAAKPADVGDFRLGPGRPSSSVLKTLWPRRTARFSFPDGGLHAGARLPAPCPRQVALMLMEQLDRDHAGPWRALLPRQGQRAFPPTLLAHRRPPRRRLCRHGGGRAALPMPASPRCPIRKASPVSANPFLILGARSDIGPRHRPRFCRRLGHPIQLAARNADTHGGGAKADLETALRHVEVTLHELRRAGRTRGMRASSMGCRFSPASRSAPWATMGDQSKKMRKTRPSRPSRFCARISRTPRSCSRGSGGPV